MQVFPPADRLTALQRIKANWPRCLSGVGGFICLRMHFEYETGVPLIGFCISFHDLWLTATFIFCLCVHAFMWPCSPPANISDYPPCGFVQLSASSFLFQATCFYLSNLFKGPIVFLFSDHLLIQKTLYRSPEDSLFSPLFTAVGKISALFQTSQRADFTRFLKSGESKRSEGRILTGCRHTLL